jgi:hypothetical protein
MPGNDDFIQAVFYNTNGLLTNLISGHCERLKGARQSKNITKSISY